MPSPTVARDRRAWAWPGDPEGRQPQTVLLPMGGAQVQSSTPTPPTFWPLERGRGGGGGWDTKCYLVPGLSFKGGIFNEQQTTSVPITEKD